MTPRAASLAGGGVAAYNPPDPTQPDLPETVP
jgi:hypothetical protein